MKTKLSTILILLFSSLFTTGFSCRDCSDCQDEMDECVGDSACGIDDMLVIVEEVLAKCYP